MTEISCIDAKYSTIRMEISLNLSLMLKDIVVRYMSLYGTILVCTFSIDLVE
jgi:hypothetical protein